MRWRVFLSWRAGRLLLSGRGAPGGNSMNRLGVFAILSLALAGCQPTPQPAEETAKLTQGAMTLADARAGLVTKLARKERDGTAPDKPPAGVFELVKFASPAGQLW